MMSRKFASPFVAFTFAFAICFSIPGCGNRSQPSSVAESEDEIAEYEAMLEEMQEETAEEADDVGQ